MAGGAARSRGHARRDASASPFARARHRRAGGAGLQQLVARRESRERGRLIEGRAGSPRLARHQRRARVCGSGRRSARGRSGALLRARRGAALRASAHHVSARRGHDDRPRRAHGAGVRTAPFRGALRRDRSLGGARADGDRLDADPSPLLRRGLADRRRRLARPRGDVSQVALRQGRRRRLPQHSARSSAIRSARA